MMVKYPACVHLPVFKEWHASVVLDKSGMLNLIEKVRVLASDTPHILQNRLDVTITDSMDGAMCLDMFDKVSKLYTTHIRSIEDDMLPSRTDNPTVLRCRCVLEDHRKDRSGQALPSGKRSHEKAMWVTVILSERPGGVAAKVTVVEA
ncbi:hypothetical protein QFC21_007100 [Naganishia friedmannii]|uniref:Uncharacterized protein n=1 Tax=Naganishia friedmannii TaxID=89922 RepID=A0ACC2UYD8_9TREE|nr:hypothetical protein QFC21_007100 [Naganishia friedmannii]